MARYDFQETVASLTPGCFRRIIDKEALSEGLPSCGAKQLDG
jgi:hypothetical protein